MLDFYSDEELESAAAELYDQFEDSADRPDGYTPEFVDYMVTTDGRAVLHLTVRPPSPESIIDPDELGGLVPNPFESSIGPVVTRVTLLEPTTIQ